MSVVTAVSSQDTPVATPFEDPAIIGPADVRAAAERLAGVAVRTPLLESPALNALGAGGKGARILCKAEPLQVSGSFKFRGAYNRLSRMSAEDLRRGVVAWSSGNHAQGVAAAAQMLGAPAIIVMPKDAPRMKVERTRRSGAEIVFYDRYTEDREEIGRAIVAERGMTLVPSYDDPHVMAGQGTLGLEVAEDVAAMGAQLDAMLVCTGGGGMIAGCATILSELSPATSVYAVEPEAFDDHARSLASGRLERIDPAARSICDALLTPSPGALTFPVNARLLAGAVGVSDEEVLRAMRLAFRELKIVVEPGGAVALAAALSDRLDLAGKTVAVTLSGGNVDEDLFARALTGTLTGDPQATVSPPL